MRVWALSDLHLSFARPKPMDVFGSHWRDHRARIERAWMQRVAPEDTICLPGDLSWAMRLSEAAGELEWLDGLPGRKILVKGNHDYWWSSVGKLRRALPRGMYALQNDAVLLDGVGFAGARGWVDPGLDFGAFGRELLGDGAEPSLLQGIRGGEEDRKIYDRELERLNVSLRSLDPEAALRIALLHFPPTSPNMEETPVTRLLEKHRVHLAIFGHLHRTGGESFANPFGTLRGITYYLVSADFADFAPVLIAQV